MENHGNLEAYNRMIESDLLVPYKGKYVAFVKGRFAGHGENESYLGRKIREEFGEISFYITKVE